MDTERNVCGIQGQGREVFMALLGKGYPEGLCREIAKRLGTDYTAARMLGYLYRHAEPPRPEDVVDEMIAILSDRDMLIKRHEMEAAQAKLNRLYRNGFEDGEGNG